LWTRGGAAAAGWHLRPAAAPPRPAPHGAAHPRLCFPVLSSLPARDQPVGGHGELVTPSGAACTPAFSILYAADEGAASPMEGAGERPGLPPADGGGSSMCQQHVPAHGAAGQVMLLGRWWAVHGRGAAGATPPHLRGVSWRARSPPRGAPHAPSPPGGNRCAQPCSLYLSHSLSTTQTQTDTVSRLPAGLLLHPPTPLMTGAVVEQQTALQPRARAHVALLRVFCVRACVYCALPCRVYLHAPPQPHWKCISCCAPGEPRALWQCSARTQLRFPRVFE